MRRRLPGLAALVLLLPTFLVAQSESQRSRFTQRLVAAALERTQHFVRYNPAYVKIPYPGGDVPADTGVCTDEITRIYRAVGVDLQKRGA